MLPDVAFGNLKLSEIEHQNELLCTPQVEREAVKIVILRDITLEPIESYLKYLGYKESLNIELIFSHFDTIVQDVFDQQSYIYTSKSDIIIIALKLEMLSSILTRHFSGVNQKDVDAEIIRIVDYIENIVSCLRKNIQSTILLHNFEIPVYPAFGVLDYQEESKQLHIIRRLNREFVRLRERYNGMYVIDVDLLQSKLGYVNFFDTRFWHIGKAPYTPEALKSLAKEYMKIIRALKGKNKKCLVLDCDNTLWGGIIGEDGINKIRLGQTYPGSAFVEFQEALLELYHRGVILAICSKNSEHDVVEVLDKHPDMVLRRKHFALMKINWQDKVENLKQIAVELNIGLDSIVFVDDNAFETGLVEQMLPQVRTLKLPQDTSSYKDLIKSCGWFDSLSFSEVDRKRTEMYITDRARQQAQHEFDVTLIEDYLKSLDMEVTIKRADDFSIPRIAQLTQRTNQFNLTTKRYSEQDIQRYSHSQDADVFTFQVRDKFGDLGIIGTVIVFHTRGESVIDTFLLSCRALGRSVEEVMLNTCIRSALRQKSRSLLGTYIPTQRNVQVEHFFPNHGFQLLEQHDKAYTYMLSLEQVGISLEYNSSSDVFKSVNMML